MARHYRACIQSYLDGGFVMRAFLKAIRPHVLKELSAAEHAERLGEFSVAFYHLERAHVLGQSSTLLHVRVHWAMFVWGWRRRKPAECLGQIVRIVGAATKTAVGLIPQGNTGGSNISAFRPMPIPPDLQEILVSAEKER